MHFAVKKLCDCMPMTDHSRSNQWTKIVVRSPSLPNIQRYREQNVLDDVGKNHIRYAELCRYIVDIMYIHMVIVSSWSNTTLEEDTVPIRIPSVTSVWTLKSVKLDTCRRFKLRTIARESIALANKASCHAYLTSCLLIFPR